jgi:hypothetical protein
LAAIRTREAILPFPFSLVFCLDPAGRITVTARANAIKGRVPTKDA